MVDHPTKFLRSRATRPFSAPEIQKLEYFMSLTDINRVSLTKIWVSDIDTLEIDTVENKLKDQFWNIYYSLINKISIKVTDKMQLSEQ